MNTTQTDLAALTGRTLLALIFIVSGYGKLTGFAGTAAYMASKGMPLVEVLLAGAIVVELLGGLALAAGWKARWAAAAIFLFVIPTTVIFHNPAGLDPQAAQGQMIHLMKNLAIMGGLAMVFAFGPGAWSLDPEMNREIAMKSARAIERVIDSSIAPVGTFTVRRALPDRARHAVGPWVFLDHFGPFAIRPGDDGVGPHPHAGIETVTYLLTGRNEHRDSAGNRGIVSAGGAQWMTAGRGIVHAEKPLAEGDEELTQHGIQLWTSLPRALKMMPPRYQRIEATAIPTVARDGLTVRVIGGAFEDTQGPADALMPLFLWHASIASGAIFETGVSGALEVAAYVIDGEGTFGADGTAVASTGKLVVWENAEGTIRIANAGPKALEVLVLGGAPAEGPLVFHGPFVMNSVEQVRAAEIAYRTGRMGELS